MIDAATFCIQMLATLSHDLLTALDIKYQDCDRNDIEGELVKFHYSHFSKVIYEHMFRRHNLKCVPNVMDDHIRELKRQKSNDQAQSKSHFMSTLLSKYL